MDEKLVAHVVRELQEDSPALRARYTEIPTFMRRPHRRELRDLDIGMIGVPFDLGVTTRPGADGMVAIQVADTGIGIAPEDLIRIYDPFFTTKSKGLGLGLAICYEIIERHQGTLDATSQVGQGSTFTIRLPVIE